MKKLYLSITALCLGMGSVFASSPIVSADTPYTIMKVREATFGGADYIIGSGYNGELVCVDYNGDLVWENEMSGYVNHDIYCEDIDDDGNDEIFVACANGSLYCVSHTGEELWSFKKNDVPLYAVTVVDNDGVPTVVCGGYDKNVYCLSVTSTLLSTYSASEFSGIKSWLKDGTDAYTSSINFLTKLSDKSGKEYLVIHGVVYNMSGDGEMHVVDLSKTIGEDINPILTSNDIFDDSTVVGSCSVYSAEGADDRIIYGSSSMISGSGFSVISVDYNGLTTSRESYTISSGGGVDSYGYRVAQAEAVSDVNSFRYAVLFGSNILLVDEALSSRTVLSNGYSYNDICYNDASNKIILASCQSGGNQIHIIDLNNDEWQDAYESLVPAGNITSILESTAALSEQLDIFERPSWERENKPVYYLSDDATSSPTKEYVGRYNSTVFLGNIWTNKVEDPVWRDTMNNETYRDKRDSRFTYSYTSDECFDVLSGNYDETDYGGAYWAGHGNDPFMYSPATLTNLLASDKAKGKKSVLIYPELQDDTSDFEYVINNLFVARAAEIEANDQDANIYLRNKDVFWLASIHLSMWSEVLSGKYADVFVPSMEETSDRVMDLTIAGRLGLWCSDAFTSWGSRCARDNTSYDRLRQYSHQMLPNHFLRMLVYHVSYGSQYLDLFEVDQDYMKILYDMIGKGLVYVPNKEEVVSFNPVYLAMREPHENFLTQGTTGKFTTQYDTAEVYNDENMVFSRLNATWPGGAVNEWDFSSYASGVSDRRLNFLPPYPYGMVMIAPVEDLAAPRGELTSHLHPLYKEIMKSYQTDGKYYYDGLTAKSADTYYTTVKSDIETMSKKIPLTVEGEAAWVTAQTAPKHLRLTLIDGGYIDPASDEVAIKFHTVTPVKITDLVTGEKFYPNGAVSEVRMTVPTGLFRFLDIELESEL